jgi:hypothetical protein
LRRPEAPPLVDELAAPQGVGNVTELPPVGGKFVGESVPGQKRYFSPTVTTPIGSDEPPKLGYTSRLALTDQ